MINKGKIIYSLYCIFITLTNFAIKVAWAEDSYLLSYPISHKHQRFRRNTNLQCQSEATELGCNITTVFSHVLKGYDKRLRPYEGEPYPTVVTVGMNILRLGNINEVNMDYKMDLHLIQVYLKLFFLKPFILAKVYSE